VKTWSDANAPRGIKLPLCDVIIDAKIICPKPPSDQR